MSRRDTVGRAARLPAGINYAPDGTPVLAYIPGARDLGPLEQLLAKRPRNEESAPLQDALDDFVTATLLLEEALSLVDRKAREARGLGATWSQIGRRAGVTPQSAQQRWSTDGNLRHSRRRQNRAQSKTNDGANDG